MASSDALRRCAEATQERRQRGEQIEVLQVLVEQGALERGLASSLWRELQASGPAPRPAPSSESGRLGTLAPAPGPTGAWSPNAPTLRGDFASPDATPTLGPAAIGQGMPGFPGSPPQGYGNGSFNSPPPGGGYGPPGGGPPATHGFGPPQGYGSGSFNAPPQPGFGPPQGYGSGSFNAPPQPGFGPPQGYGSGSFNAPAQPGFAPPQGFAPGQGFAPPPGAPGVNGGPGFGPAPGYPGQLPPPGGGYDPSAQTVRSPVGGLQPPPVADTVRSPVGGFGAGEDLASTVKAPAGRPGPVDFQSDFDPLGSGFGSGPTPSHVGVAPQSQAAFPVDLAPPPAAEFAPAAEPPAAEPPAKKPRSAGASSRRKKASGREAPVSGRVRAARAKREKRPSPAIYVGAGVALLLLLVLIVAVVAGSGSDPKPSPSPEATPVDVLPEPSASNDPPPPPKATPSRRPAGGAEGPIPAKYLEPGSSAEAPVRAEDLEGDLVGRGDHMVQQGEYQEALTLAKEALDKWPSWLEGTPAHERFKRELKRREKQLRFSQHLEALLKDPKSPGVAKMIGAIAGQHLHPDLEDLPCVHKFKGDMMEKLGEDEYDAIFVQEFDPKELQDDFKDDE